jgi:orotate phosphoribosyltransferase
VNNNKSLAAKIREASHLRGTFTLRSGRIASEYFDKYKFEADPGILSEITQKMVELIPPGTEILAGLELGGIPVVTMLSHYSGIPAAFVRKAAKEYGTANLAEGAEVSGKNVLIIEDIVTSGGQVVLSSNDLRLLGANISYALCVIDREEGGTENLAANKIKLLSLFKKSDLEG